MYKYYNSAPYLIDGFLIKYLLHYSAFFLPDSTTARFEGHKRDLSSRTFEQDRLDCNFEDSTFFAAPFRRENPAATTQATFPLANASFQ